MNLFCFWFHYWRCSSSHWWGRCRMHYWDIKSWRGQTNWKSRNWFWYGFL